MAEVTRVTGGAWLSSARVVRCWVKSRNERNPCLQLPSFPLWPGLHAYYNGVHNKKQYSDVEQNLQITSQFGSKSATRLREVGIASNRGSACRGEYVLGACTHRPSNHESR